MFTVKTASKFVLAAVLGSFFLTTFAVAADEIYTPDTIVYMNLGRAPFRGQVSGRMELKNAGPNDLTDIRYDISGPGFSARDNCPKVLAPQKSCRITITYWAQIPGYVSASMWLKTSDKNYDIRISASSDEDPFRDMPRPPTFPRP